MEDKLLTIAEVAAITRVAEATVRRWRLRGCGPESFKVNGRVVYRQSAVTLWVMRQEARSGGVPAA